MTCIAYPARRYQAVRPDDVREGYERIAETYAAQRDQFKSAPYLKRFIDSIPPGSKILDLGCGAGQPVDAFLVAHGFQVHGIDISERMIDLARRNVPEATYEVRNMMDLADREITVDGIVAFYSIFHTPRSEHRSLLDRLASFLDKGGSLLITMGAVKWEGIEDFHGTDMYWSHFGQDENIKMVERAGFRILFDETDHSGDEQHQIILARLADDR
jgi:cyclopropane fatty-acyl-phospholipid synthase-like methyltransferase